MPATVGTTWPCPFFPKASPCPFSIEKCLNKDPLLWRLVNEGVSSNNPTDEATVRYELETFVCEGDTTVGSAESSKGI